MSFVKNTRASRKRRRDKHYEEVYQEDPCLFPDCNRGKLYRGLCNKHYTAACRGRKAGDYTFEQLVSVGLMTPKKVNGQHFSPSALVAAKRPKK